MTDKKELLEHLEQRVKRIYPWYPLGNLLHVALRPDLVEPRTSLTHVQLGLDTYVATREHDYGWTKVTEEMVIPPEVVAEMTEDGVVFTVNMHDEDPLQSVADRINAAAQRCAFRYMRKT